MHADQSYLYLGSVSAALSCGLSINPYHPSSCLSLISQRSTAFLQRIHAMSWASMHSLPQTGVHCLYSADPVVSYREKSIKPPALLSPTSQSFFYVLHALQTPEASTLGRTTTRITFEETEVRSIELLG